MQGSVFTPHGSLFFFLGWRFFLGKRVGFGLSLLQRVPVELGCSDCLLLLP